MNLKMKLLLTLLVAHALAASASILRPLFLSSIISTGKDDSGDGNGNGRDSNSITLRIRSLSGTVQRMDVSTAHTIAELHGHVLEVIDGSKDENYTLSFCGYSYNTSDLLLNTSLISETSLKTGEIVSVTLQETKTKERERHETKGTGSQASQATRQSTSTSTRRTSTTKKSLTLDDISKRKESLPKIKRQKADGTKVVRLSAETSRVLKRILDNKGVALLLGRFVNGTEQSSTSSKGKGKGGSIKTAASLDKKSATDYFDVVSACELFGTTQSSSSSFSSSPGSDSHHHPHYSAQIADSYDLVDSINQLAASLDLEIVGCCIGIGCKDANANLNPNPKSRAAKGDKEREREQAGGRGDTWSPAHVHASLQVEP